jgi:hypothetical protein
MRLEAFARCLGELGGRKGGVLAAVDADGFCRCVHGGLPE